MPKKTKTAEDTQVELIVAQDSKEEKKAASRKTKSTAKRIKKEDKKVSSGEVKATAEENAVRRPIPAEEAAAQIDVIVKAMQDKKAKGICSLDMKPLGTAISDYFVICNADSTTQVNAIADNVEEEMYRCCGREVVRSQGKENAFWIILDYTDIVIHIFQTEYREFYRLEDLWADAIRKDYNE